LSEWLEARDLSWAKHAGTPRLLLNYIGFLLPVLAHDEEIARLKDWLREHPDAFLRWGHWFLLACEAWQMFAAEKTLAGPWASAFLVGHELSNWPVEKIWKRQLIVDLGPDLTGIEVELILQISKVIDLTVFVPSEESRRQHGSCLWPYSLLLGEELKIRPTQGEKNPTQAELQYHRFSSPLAEVKMVTSEIRRLLDLGIPTAQIGIFAARIEDYWSILEAYLRIEGVPVAKSVVMTVGSLHSVARWLARARLGAQQVSSGDLEQVLFAGQTKPPLTYEEFAPLFRQIYELEDLGRDQRVENIFQKNIDPKDKIDRDTFFGWILKYWEGDNFGVEKIAAEFLQECPIEMKLELRSWVHYIEALAAKIELKVAEGEMSEGVVCGNFDASAHLSLEHVFLLGLSESQLSEEKNLAVSLGDLLQLTNDLGLRLPELSSMPGEYWVDTIARQTREKVHLSFSATNISGDPETPGLSWLNGAQSKLESIEACQAPEWSRWDEIQQSPFGDEDSLKVISDIELGRRPRPTIQHSVELRYSASQLQKYQDCPFVFAAEKLFRLSERPDIDLDIDAMTSGQLIHAVLEKILAEPLNLDRNDNELREMIDGVRRELQMPIAVEALWPQQREKYVLMAQRFLKFEREWRKRFAKTKTVAREVALKGDLELTPEKKIRVSGKIDRIDRSTNGEYVVLDYKSSGAGLRNYAKWLENDEIQLLFYALCIEQGLVEVEASSVWGAFYFFLNTMSREKGFRDLRGIDQMYGAARTTEIERKELVELYEALKFKINEIVLKIEAGHLAPEPKDLDDCYSCDWKTVCRAQHLN
jgi:CRISPR/Cas system-associated exonuclease Cas4 (RecB family)